VLLFGVPLLAWVCGGIFGSRIWGEAAGVCLAAGLLVVAMSVIGANRSTLRSWIKLELIAPHGHSDEKRPRDGSGLG
jgi:hypothetical protein